MSNLLHPIPQEAGQNSDSYRLPLYAIALLLLTAAVTLIRSHYQLLWGDELGFGLSWLDLNSSLARLVHIELTTPVSFDPLFFNYLIYFAIHYFGGAALAMRLPSICGYLSMELCLFYFVRRIAGERAGCIALALPALLGIVSYSVEARPYGLMLGLSAFALLSWQTATRRTTRRVLPLTVLALCLFLDINTQFYSVLFFIPLGVAELARIVERRRLDLPMLLSVAAGASGLFIAVPFARALLPFRSNHPAEKAASLHFISHAYLWLIIGYDNFSIHAQHCVALALILATFLLFAAFLIYRSRIVLNFPFAEMLFVLVLSAFPLLGYLMGNFVTHFIEARYIQPAVLGFIPLAAIAIAPLLQNVFAARSFFSCLFLVVAVVGIVHIRVEKRISHSILRSLVLDPSTQKNLAMYPSQPIYVTNPTAYQLLGLYAPSSDLRARTVLAYPRPGDYISAVGADVQQQMVNMRLDGVPNVVPFEDLAMHGKLHLFLFNRGDWTRKAFAQSHAQIQNLGSVLGGQIVAVRFP